MSERKKISLAPAAPARDPRRRPVRGGRAPLPPVREPAPRAEGPARRGPRSQPVAEPRPAPRPAPRPLPPSAPPAPQPVAVPDATAPAGVDGQGQRVSKLITARGIASRREADAWIEAGWVRVDGQMAVLGQRARADAVITIDPRAQAQQARRVTILLHKPVGYVSGQAEDGHEPAVVLIRPENRWRGDRACQTWHPGQLRGLAPAGRLDIDSTGLLVLTQDGRIAKLLIGDETRVEKEYLVRVAYRGDAPDGRLPEAQLERLRHGLELDGVPLKPARVSWQNEDQLRFVLREGRKRQIRRMCELVGLEVLGLKRVRIGSVVLGQLPVGQWRYLDEHERFV